MPTEIQSLPVYEIDFRAGGTEYMLGYRRVGQAISSNRDGFVRVDTIFQNGTVPLILRTSDLYVLGFRAGGSWWRFSDADWPLRPEATSLGHDGQYDSLGGLTGELNAGSLRNLGKLASPEHRGQWKGLLRVLLVAVAESLRLVPVQMAVLGALNEVGANADLSSLERYIKNWGKASKGTDMSVEAGPNLRTGFSDPTIIRR